MEHHDEQLTERCLFLPFTIRLMNRDQELCPDPEDLYLICVLSGRIRFKDTFLHILRETDIYAPMTGCETWSFSIQDKPDTLKASNSPDMPEDPQSMAALIAIDRTYAAALNDDRSFLFDVDTLHHSDNRYLVLTHQIRRLTQDYFSARESDAALLLEDLDACLKTILAFFSKNGKEEDPREIRLLHLLRRRYTQPLTLTGLSEALGISAQYTSVFIKQCLGMPLTVYLNRRRAAAARRSLTRSEFSVTEICAACGFANFNAFNKTFRSLYGCSAAVYRSRHAEPGKCLLTSDAPEYECHAELFKTWKQDAAKIYPAPGSGRTVVHCDLAACRSEPLPAADMIHFQLEDPWSAQTIAHLHQITEQLHVRWVRLGDIMGKIEQDPVTKAYSFRTVERILVPLTATGVKPIFMILIHPDFDILPRTEALLHYLTSSFGRHRIREWRFEYIVDTSYRMQTDPHPSDVQTLAGLAIRLIRIIKAACPEIQTGDSSINTNFPTAFTEAMLRRMAQAGTLPDYHTLQLYTSIPDEQMADLRFATRYIISTNPHLIVQQIRSLRGMIRGASGQEHAVLHAQICFSLQKQNILNESIFAAAFMITNMLQAMPYVSGFILPVMDDRMHFTYTQDTGLYPGIFSLMTTQGLKKPLFFALRMLYARGTLPVLCREDCLITADPDRKLSLLLVNYVHPDRFYCGHPSDLAPTDIRSVFPAKAEKTFDITIEGTGSGTWLAEEWCLDLEHGDNMRLWVEGGQLPQMTPEVIEHLKSHIQPGYRYYTLKADARIHYTTVLKMLEVRLIHLTPLPED